MTSKSASYRKTVRIDTSESGERLDKVLAQRLVDVSRTQLAKWIRDGSITIGGGLLRPNHKLSGGELVEVAGEFRPKHDWDSATNIAINIVYEDEDVLVVDKPAGLVVHPGAATVAPTLANGLLAIRPKLGKLARAGIVHRLDKDTTGLMVVAASEFARVHLVNAIAKRNVSRSYLAIVEGHLQASREVNLPLGRSSRDRTRQTVRTNGREASTLFEPIAEFRCHTLIRAQLRTGRTHQIRVHAARIGLPLAGDVKYGAKRLIPPNADQVLRDMLATLPRQALHAYRLAFEHPRTQDTLRFEAPLPLDLRELVSALKDDLVGQP